MPQFRMISLIKQPKGSKGLDSALPWQFAFQEAQLGVLAYNDPRFR
jgi:hypothetical protein